MSFDPQDGSSRLIGAAIAVHRTVGPGFVESVYENALAIDLTRREIPFVRQMSLPIHYEKIEVGRHVLDLLVEDRLVVELKAVKQLEDIHFVILRSDLKAAGKEVGLILNFAQVTLDIKRVVARTYEPGCPLSDFGVSGFPRS